MQLTFHSRRHFERTSQQMRILFTWDFKWRLKAKNILQEIQL